MSATDPVISEPRRFSIPLPRPLWIGLATGVLVVAVGLQLGIPIYRQHMAIREIERVGGASFARSYGPEWLRNWAGDERIKPFDTVFRVELSGSVATDSTLDVLSCLTDMDTLWLVDANVTDAGLEKLKGLRSLQGLALTNTKVTHEGLDELKKAFPGPRPRFDR